MLKNIRQNGFIFPRVRGENKENISNHHLDMILPSKILYHNTAFWESGNPPKQVARGSS